MIIIRTLRFLLVALVLTSAARAQLSTTLRLSKVQYLAGEPVIAVLTITNHAGRQLTFDNDGRSQWLNFALKDNHGALVTLKGQNTFGRMSIQAGETMAREINLSDYYQLNDPGSFSVEAYVHLPGSKDEGSPSNRISFTQGIGFPYWSQKVGISGKSEQIREFRILNFSGNQKVQIYAQIIECRTGQNVRTFLLGDVMMMRKPLATVDRTQRLHVMFLATPTMWVHCQIDTDGKVVSREIHQRGTQGDPQLITFADGTVRVGNSIPYNQKAAAEAKSKIRKASDRPNFN